MTGCTERRRYLFRLSDWANARRNLHRWARGEPTLVDPLGLMVMVTLDLPLRKDGGLDNRVFRYVPLPRKAVPL